MERIEELKKQIAEAENKLKILARQNIEYNAEIERLKVIRDSANKESVIAENNLTNINIKIDTANKQLDLLLRDIAKSRIIIDDLKSTSSEIISSLDKQKQDVVFCITGLKANKEGLVVEVNNLLEQKKLLSDSTSKTSSSLIDSENKLRKLNLSISTIENNLNEKNIELNKKTSIINDLKIEHSSLLDNIKEKKEYLESLIDSKEKELLNIQDTIDGKLRKLNIDIKDKEQQLSEREEFVIDKENKNTEDSLSLNKLREALESRGKELKLYELKLRDIAKKKDIDIQISSFL